MAGQIYRRKKSGDFVTLDTHCLRDTNLKWDAKGLHSYLMQLPDDWKVNISDLTNRGADGKNATITPMTALIKAGYVVRKRKHSANGTFEGYEYYVFERPEHAAEWLTISGKSVDGKSVNGKSVNGKSATNKYEEYQSIKSTNYEDNEADKPHTTPQNKIETDQQLNENLKKPNSFNGRGAAKKTDGGEVSEVVKFLNETVNPACNFRESSKTTAAHIRQRIAEGFTVSDICIVIEHKNSQWRNDPKMSEYLRPATLFGTGKFEAYLIAARTWENGGKKSPQNSATYQNQTRSVTTDFGGDKSKFEQPQVF